MTKRDKEEFLLYCLNKAIQTQEDIDVPFQEYMTWSVARSLLYALRKKNNLSDLVSITWIENEKVIVKPKIVTNSFATISNATAGQISTNVTPSREHLSAYRILMDSKVIEVVELIGMTRERFDEMFPDVKAFEISTSKHGLLLL